MSEKLPILDCGNLSKYMRDSCGLEKKRLYRRFNDWNVSDTNKSGKIKQTTIQPNRQQFNQTDNNSTKQTTIQPNRQQFNQTDNNSTKQTTIQPNRQQFNQTDNNSTKQTTIQPKNYNEALAHTH